MSDGSSVESQIEALRLELVKTQLHLLTEIEQLRTSAEDPWDGGEDEEDEDDLRLMMKRRRGGEQQPSCCAKVTTGVWVAILERVKPFDFHSSGGCDWCIYICIIISLVTSFITAIYTAFATIGQDQTGFSIDRLDTVDMPGIALCVETKLYSGTRGFGPNGTRPIWQESVSQETWSNWFDFAHAGTESDPILFSRGWPFPIPNATNDVDGDGVVDTWDNFVSVGGNREPITDSGIKAFLRESELGNEEACALINDDDAFALESVSDWFFTSAIMALDSGDSGYLSKYRVGLYHQGDGKYDGIDHASWFFGTPGKAMAMSISVSRFLDRTEPYPEWQYVYGNDYASLDVSESYSANLVGKMFNGTLVSADDLFEFADTTTNTSSLWYRLTAATNTGHDLGDDGGFAMLYGNFGSFDRRSVTQNTKSLGATWSEIGGAWAGIALVMGAVFIDLGDPRQRNGVVRRQVSLRWANRQFRDEVVRRMRAEARTAATTHVLRRYKFAPDVVRAVTGGTAPLSAAKSDRNGSRPAVVSAAGVEMTATATVSSLGGAQFRPRGATAWVLAADARLQLEGDRRVLKWGVLAKRHRGRAHQTGLANAQGWSERLFVLRREAVGGAHLAYYLDHTAWSNGLSKAVFCCSEVTCATERDASRRLCLVVRERGGKLLVFARDVEGGDEATEAWRIALEGAGCPRGAAAAGAV